MKAIYIAGLFLLVLIISGCTETNENLANEQNEREAKANELVLAVGGEPEEGFDPTTGWGRYGSPLFQSTLLVREQDLSITGDLAEDYEVSDDGQTWTVTLREDALFSDGEPVTADDVIFTFETAMESGSIVDVTMVDTIEKLDDFTVQFLLEHPLSTFTSLLVTTGIVPKHAYDENYQETPIGSGPYQLVQWDKGQQLIVKENPHYYGEKPNFEKLTFLFLAEDTAFAAARAGEVDVVSVPSIFAKEDVPGMDLVVLDSVDNRGIMFPFPPDEETGEGNTIGNDVTADPVIREAINQAVDRQALVNGVLDGYGSPAYTNVDGLPWWNDETVIADADMEGAKELLDASGWHETEDGIREKEGLRAEFTLLYPADDVIRQSLSLAFADMIKPLGIDVATEGKSWSELESLVHSHPVMMGWGSHDPIEIYNLYHSDMQGEGWFNANFYNNQAVDKYMEQALQASTEEEAIEYWQKAQWDGEIGLSAKGDASWAWLVNLHHLYFVREGLDIGEQKIQPHGHGWPVTDFITQWKWVD
ncbi:ABC transporter substrate-binding protein [Desertibacillus haloalkaliphilus]|uniref:ABC transporter substrate-binding protein n=1 Tax=Desertibacillus haloalkaliphilus TaxID=1328930 RepID=UPI001C26835F|nr:ABC transporter substrate-binding protein [Desertibacillus haloalkaliphilus]MBU8906352.1 ABC transporter substrate-binding protein [Desertibacillus haloalkaliphilus]